MIPLLLACAWLATLIALASGQRWAEVVAGVVAVALPLLVYRGVRGLSLACAALGVVCFAWLRWQSVTAPPEPESIAWWTDGRPHTVIGRVTQQPEVRGASQRLRVAVAEVETDAGPVKASGAIQVRLPVSRVYRKGDPLRLDGRLEPPPRLDGFDYPAYLARHGVFGVMEYPRARVQGRARDSWLARGLDAARERAHTALWRGLPAGEAALAEGILLGRRSDIPREINDDFQRSGVSHLIVISGYNIALLGGLVTGGTAWLLGRRRAGVIALGAILLYSVFVGLTPPVARAAAMGAIVVLALVSGRPYGAGTALLFAADVLTLQDPRILQDVSFQLSFTATAGLLVLSPPLVAWGQRLFSEPEAGTGPSWRSLAFAGWSTLAVTLAATVATLPLLLVNFGRLSLVSPIANLILVPLFPAVLLTGALGAGVAALVPGVAAEALIPLGGLLAAATTVARFCAALPGSGVQVAGFSAGHAALAYVLLAAAAVGRVSGRGIPVPDVLVHPATPLFSRPLPVLSFAPATLLLLAAGTGLLNRQGPPRETRVEVFNLAGTPAALVTLAGGGRVLVDTGLSPAGARSALDNIGLQPGSLVAVAIMRDIPSAVGGLSEVLDRYRPPLLLVPPEAADAAWVEDARMRGMRVQEIAAGLTLAGALAHLEVTPAAERGRWSVAVRHGDRMLAATGAAGEGGIMRDGRATLIFATVDGGRLQMLVPSGGRAAVSTDGERLRIHRPRAGRLDFVPCPIECGRPPSRD